MRRLFVVLILTVDITFGAGCATKLNFLPEYEIPGSVIHHFSPDTTKIITTDSRSNKKNSENIAEVVTRCIKSALKGDDNINPHTVYIDILNHESYFISSRWIGNTRFQVTVKDSNNTISSFEVSGQSSKFNTLGYLTAKSASQEAFHEAINNIILNLCNINTNYTENKNNTSITKTDYYSKNNKSKSLYSDKIVEIYLKPTEYAGYFKSFNLTIINKSSKSLKILWNDSYFIENGVANGGFMFEGIRYIDRNAPKQNLMILANTTSTKEIFPCEKVINMGYDRLASNMGLPTGWQHGIMKNGTFGALLKIVGNKYNKEIKLTVDIR